MKQNLPQHSSAQVISSSAALQPAMAYSPRTVGAEVLTTLAVLKVHEGQGYDYLQNFMPFVAECLYSSAKSSNIITIKLIQDGLKRSFGFDVPAGVVQTLLRRAEKLGYVRLRDRLYEPVREVLETYSIERDREAAGAELDKLTADLQVFVLGEFAVELSTAEAETALFEFIAEHGVYALPDVQQTSTIKKEESNSTHYLVGAFVDYLLQTDPRGFSYFERAVQGSMLASVLHFERKVNVVEQWKNAKVYLDTPIILRLIGLYGDELAAPYLELVKMLQAQGVPVHCFYPTLSEVNGVLYSLEEELRRGNRKFRFTDELGEVMLAAGKTAADLKVERSRVERKLLALGITAHDYPRAQAHLTPDYGRVEEVFQRVVKYQHDNARAHDVEAVLAIHRLRSGNRPTQVERSYALFVTTNAGVVQAAREVYKTELNYRGQDVYGCILADVLSTVVWLKGHAQLGARDELSRKQLIADAYAVMKPTPALWAAYINELQRLSTDNFVSEEDVLYLRCAPEAINALTRTTFNNVSSFTEGTIEQVLVAARAAISRDAEAKQAEAEAAVLQAKEELVCRDAEIHEKVRQLEAEERSRITAEAQTAHHQAESARKDEELNRASVVFSLHRHRAAMIGKTAGWVAFMVFGTIALWPTWKYGLAPSIPPELLHFAVPLSLKQISLNAVVSFGLFVGLALLGLWGPAKDIRNWIARIVEKKLEAWLLGK